MKDINDNIALPFALQISFDAILRHYEALLDSDDEFLVAKAKYVLEAGNKHPILREGFTDYSILEVYKKEIDIILRDAFSPVLTKNEIKIASIPFENVVFNASKRFKNIIKDAGEGFELKIKNLPENDRYIITCITILNFYYGYELNVKRPFFYEIPDGKGVMRYYKILYNADFIDVTKADDAPEITNEDIDHLLDNFENIELWKTKFPANSYLFKGFAISNIFDVTDDQTISAIKSNLIAEGKRKDENFIENLQKIFNSFFNIPDLKVGFSTYSKTNDTFHRVHGEGMHSFLLHNLEIASCSDALCKWSYNRLLKESKYFSISDVDKMFEKTKGEIPHVKILHEQGIKSAIFAPINSRDGLLGILELVSETPKVLNSINASKLVDIMPYIATAVERSKKEHENLIEAVIQQECTSIHSSVHWRFKEAAEIFINENILQDKKTSFNKIIFENVYPLFGQIDVKGSSEARNLSTQKDLSLQLSLIKKIFDEITDNKNLPIFEQIKFQVEHYVNEVEQDFKVDSEHQIAAFFHDDIEPLFKFIKKSIPKLSDDIDNYFSKIDDKLGVIYFYRKNYDDTITLINKNMSNMLDKKQVEAQKMYPHFFERFKTDGVEHNMYIGESITKENSFNPIYLYNLRLWQLQVMCEMENTFYNNQHEYPLSLDVASMILVFNQSLSIRFRMDEKQFDVDGTYNARYEVVKKRVDKAYIKGTQQRVTDKGKIAIVFSQKEDEMEYMRYINFLQSKSVLGDVEIVELEDLQGVTGLKAIRANILYHTTSGENFYSYDDLMETLKN